MDYHAVHLVRISSWRRLQGGKLVSARFWKGYQNDARSLKLQTNGYSRSIKFRATGRDRGSVKWKESFYLRPNTDGEMYINKFDDPANNLQAQRSTHFNNQVLKNTCANVG